MPATSQMVPPGGKGFRLQGGMYLTMRAGQRLADRDAPISRNQAREDMSPGVLASGTAAIVFSLNLDPKNAEQMIKSQKESLIRTQSPHKIPLSSHQKYFPLQRNTKTFPHTRICLNLQSHL